MSDGELSRLEVLRDLDQGRLTTATAAQLLGLERRQLYRLLKAYRTEGPAGLISKRRGRSSNRRKPEAVRTKALSVIRERYWDFGPTLAAEKLEGFAALQEFGRRWRKENSERQRLIEENKAEELAVLAYGELLKRANENYYPEDTGLRWLSKSFSRSASRRCRLKSSQCAVRHCHKAVDGFSTSEVRDDRFCGSDDALISGKNLWGWIG